VTSIDPASEAVGVGDIVTVTGSGFTGATSASFGSVPASNLNVVSDNSR
jgi:hypothetical protein